jgi:uncharacterized protein YjhX (UPF0386 family)
MLPNPKQDETQAQTTMVAIQIIMDLFEALRRKGLIASSNGGPYRITRQGLGAVRGRPDNR